MAEPAPPRTVPWMPVLRNVGLLWVLVLTLFLTLPFVQAFLAPRPVFDQDAIAAEFQASLTLGAAVAALATAPVTMVTWAWERRPRPAHPAVPGVCRACGADVSHCPSCGKPLA